MKRIVVAILVILMVVASIESQEAQDISVEDIIGVWNIQGNYPAYMVEFKESVCVFHLRSGEANDYMLEIRDGFVFIGTNGYRYELIKNKLVLTPAFGEGMPIITLIRKK